VAGIAAAPYETSPSFPLPPLELSGHALEIFHESFHLDAPGLIIRRPQNRGRMDRGRDARRKRRWDECAALPCDLECAAEERLGGGGAETDQNARFQQRDLRLEPRPARRDFCPVRLCMNAPLPARLPFEVFHDIRHLTDSPTDARLLQPP